MGIFLDEPKFPVIDRTPSFGRTVGNFTFSDYKNVATFTAVSLPFGYLAVPGLHLYAYFWLPEVDEPITFPFESTCTLNESFREFCKLVAVGAEEDNGVDDVGDADADTDGDTDADEDDDIADEEDDVDGEFVVLWLYPLSMSNLPDPYAA
ncbi:unnamed protein product [Closterium sp. NIES-54]